MTPTYFYHQFYLKNANLTVITLFEHTFLKYQFWKNVTSEEWNSGTLNTFGHFLSAFLSMIAEYSSNHAQKWRQTVSNVPEFHFSEVYFFQNWYFSKWGPRRLLG